jgi:hypothetical protein
MRCQMRLLAAMLGAALLAACGSRGDIAIGGGQSAGSATVDFAIAYIKRDLPTDPALLADLRGLDDIRRHRPYWTHADVYLRDRAAPSGEEHNLTASVTGTGLYDIKDLDASYDGTKLIFAMRGPIVANQQFRDPPAWHIWQYDITASTLSQITGGATDTNPNAQDVSPHYLADGRVLFSSTRQRDAKAVLTGEGKANFEAQTEDRNESAFVLHVLEIDPNTHEAVNIRQITYNQSHDSDATLLANGRIMYSRWDNAAGRNGGDGIQLYTAHPDGRDVQLLYGGQSHATGSGGSTVQFVKAREMQDGRILALVRPNEAIDFGGALHIIDVADYVENTQPVKAGSALTGPAQTAATPNDVRTLASADPAMPLPSPGGRFNSAFPLWDDSSRILVSWSQCRLLDTAGRIVPCTADNLADTTMTAAPPLYSAWLFDPVGNTLKPVIDPVENTMIQDVVALQPRTTPTFIADGSTTTQLAADGLGILDIRSVYDWDGVATGAGVGGIAGAAQRPADGRAARFLRIEKPVSLGDPDLNDGFPDYDDNLADDPNMREILGYVPIEPDGSVRVKVPANVAFRIAILDANARRIAPNHTAWLQLRPGEVLACNGCHQGGTGTSHGRADLWAADGAFASIWGGANTAGAAFPGTGATSAILPNCVGETMAQARYGLTCQSDGTPDVQDATATSAALPSVNVDFTDVWLGGGAGNAPIGFDYAALNTPRPTSFACASSWNSGCRITINYAPSGATAPAPSAAIIDPLWSVSRGAVPNGGTVGADTCINCHASNRPDTPVPCTLVINGVATTVDVPKVLGPAAGLDLSPDPAQDPAVQLRAYDQLLNAHTSPGDTGVDTTTCTQTAATAQNFPASIVKGSANASTRFFSIFAAGGSHAGRLNGAELRLLSEWVDIGAQYYNNPFNAPLK